MSSGAPDWTQKADVNIVGSTVELEVKITAATVTFDVNIASSAVTLDVNVTNAVLDVNIASQSANITIDIAAQSISDIKIMAPSGKAVNIAQAKTGIELWTGTVDAGSTVTVFSISGRGRVETIGLWFKNKGSNDVLGTYCRITIQVDGSNIVDTVAPLAFDLFQGALLWEGSAVSPDDLGDRNPKAGIIWRYSDYMCGMHISFPIEFTSSFKLIIKNLDGSYGMDTKAAIAYGIYP